MNPLRWARVRDILAAAIGADEVRRSAVLDELCAGDGELRREVESLLASHQLAGEFLETPAADLVSSPPQVPDRSRLGRRIGVYQIIELIGAGGMGEVYRAARIDGLYDKHVAIKLVRAGWDNAAVLERFRQERQILASLENPNIARLYDGGTTEEGIPYLVEELVDGLPIDRYCEDRGLGIAERLELFAQTCRAVQYAHQRLVIHRDIKPGNILVTAEGIPKLLDFGIAKVLGGTLQAEATQVLAMTPGYASPEQLRGASITTATDTYSLGVVLYRLLTGRLPYEAPPGGTRELARLICETDPRPPSALIRQDGKPGLGRGRLRDLDNIVLKALRREAERRYASVEQFAEDIRHYLDGTAVAATPDSLSYRLSTFARRHAFGVAAAALTVILVTVGAAVTWHEARVATANELRAERHFNEVRKLADTLIFEIHDSISDLPGATSARQLLVQRALQYLDMLAGESTDNIPVQRDLAAAYQRLGNIQGKALSTNVGDTVGALRSFGKALRLRTAIHAARPGDTADTVALAAILSAHAAILAVSGNIRAASDEARRAVALFESVDRTEPLDKANLERLFYAYQTLAGVLGTNVNAANLGEYDAAMAAHRGQLETVRRLVALDSTSRRYRSLEVVAELSLGDSMIFEGQYREALPHFNAGLNLLLAMTRDSAGQEAARLVYNQQLLYAAYTRVAEVQSWSGDVQGALTTARASFAVASRFSAQDPRDTAAQLTLAVTYANLADALAQRGPSPEAQRDAARAVEIAARLVRADPTNISNRVSFGILNAMAGDVAEVSKDPADALRYFRAAYPIFMKVAAEDADNVDARTDAIATQIRIADLLAQSGQPDPAGLAYQDALTRSEPKPGVTPSVETRYAIAGAEAGLAATLLQRADRLGQGSASGAALVARACEGYRRGAQMWASIPEPGLTTPNGLSTHAALWLRRGRQRCG